MASSLANVPSRGWRTSCAPRPRGHSAWPGCGTKVLLALSPRWLGAMVQGPHPRHAASDRALLRALLLWLAHASLRLCRRASLSGQRRMPGVRGLGVSLLAAMALTVAIALCASAAPSTQSCWDTGGLTTCQSAGNVQIDDPPRPLPRVFPHSDNPKWSGLGYDPRFPALGHNPKWADFGYNP